MENFNWAVGRIFSDWLRRRPKQLRQTLPPNYTTSILRLIRANACRHEVSDSVECSKWSQSNPRSEDPQHMPGAEDAKGPYSLTSEFVCGRCKHPYVTSATLISSLGLSDKKASFSDRTLRRYLNDGEPIPVEEFRRAVANAYLRGWLGVWTAYSIWQQIDRLDVTRKGLLAVLQRASERKAFRQDQVVDVSPDEFERELAKQRRLLDYAERYSLDQLAKAGNLPQEVQQFLTESLQFRCKEVAHRNTVDDALP